MSEFGPRMDLRPLERLRSLGFAIVAIVYFLFVEILAASIARGLTSGDARQFLTQGISLLLLLIGYSGMGYAFQLQRQPLKAMGLERRAGWQREICLGGALGWGAMLTCVLPIALFGGLVVTVWHSPRQIGLLLLNFGVLGLGSLGEEVAFRGYPFQRMIEAAGPTTATILMAFFFGLIHLRNPYATSASTLVTVLSGVLLATAYLQTRGLWLPWGFHFAWNAVMALVFGLPVSGMSFSAVVESNAVGPRWLTGGNYGPEGSLTALVVLVGSLILLIRVTRGYAWKYAQPVIVAGGIAVDLDRAAASRHEAANLRSPEAAATGLVQIVAPASEASVRPVKIEAELPPETDPPR